MFQKPVDQVLIALERHGYEFRRDGGGWKSRCPCHRGEGRSLAIGEGQDGKVLLHCFAHQCSAESILESIGLNLDYLFIDITYGKPSMKHQAPVPTIDEVEERIVHAVGPIAQSWIYHDATGNEFARIYRCERDGVKSYRPVHRGVTGWVIRDPEGPWPLYNLPSLLTSPGRIYIAEGEKCADLIGALGLVGTTSVHGFEFGPQDRLEPPGGKPRCDYHPRQ